MVRRGMPAVALALSILAACSGSYVVAADPVDASVDSVADAPPPADASDASDASTLAPCDLEGPFVTIDNLAELNTPGDDVGLALTDEGRTAYVVTAERVDGSYGRSLWVAKRSTSESRWGALARVPGFSGAGQVFDNPSFASDGRTLFLEVSGAGGLDIVAIPRDGTGEVSIALAKPVQGVSTPAPEFDPYVSRDGRTLYFSSDRTGDRKVYRATLDTSFSATQLDPLTTLSENGTEQDPVPTVDGTKLYFTRWTDQSPKHAELFVAKKASPGAELGQAVPVTELNTSGSEFAVDISNDGCTLYFTSDGRKPSSGGTDLYVAKKAPRR